MVAHILATRHITDFSTLAWNAATDFVLAVYPLYLFYNIQIQPHVKWGITSVMALGMVACAVAAVKTWDLVNVDDTDRLTYELYCILTWSFTETWVVLITCSIPPLWPLAKRAIVSSRAGFNTAKGWVSNDQYSQSGGGWSRPSRRNTVSLFGQAHLRTTSTAHAYSSRGRSDSTEKSFELLKHPQGNPRSASRGIADGRRESPPGGGSDTRSASRSRGKINSNKIASNVEMEYVNDGEEYEIYEPERGIMMARDLARPGIVVTKEYTVETERRKEERRGDWNPGDFGSGRAMQHNWGDPNNA